MVTQSAALAEQFGRSLNLVSPSTKQQEEEKEESKEKATEGLGGFVLGARNLSKPKPTPARSVTLRRFMADAGGKTIDEIKQYH